MSSKRKIERVDIDLGMDIEAEIRSRTDKPVIVTDEMSSLRPVSKKKRDKAAWDSKLESAVDFLSKLPEGETSSKSQLVEVAGIEPKQLGGFITRLRTYLRREDKWALQIKGRGEGKNYHLVRFGE